MVSIVRILGGIQAFAALLIIFGETLGGFILFVNIILWGVISFG